MVTRNRIPRTYLSSVLLLMMSACGSSNAALDAGLDVSPDVRIAPADCRRLTYFQGAVEDNGLEIDFDFVGEGTEIAFEPGAQAALMIRPTLIASEIGAECVEMRLEIVSDPMYDEAQLPPTNALVVVESLVVEGDSSTSSLLRHVIQPEIEGRHVIVRAVMRSTSAAWSAEVPVLITDGDGVQPCDAYPASPQFGGYYERRIAGQMEVDESVEQCGSEEVSVSFTPDTFVDGCMVPRMFLRSTLTGGCGYRFPASTRGYVSYDPQTETFSGGGVYDQLPCCDE